jgi:hypothetical protein
MATMFDPMQSMLQQTPELLDLSRQRKMADLLMSKGLQAPQGQTVSGGVYVPPNPMEYIGNLFNVYAGSEANKALDVKQKEYADAIRNLESTESSNILQALQGTPEKVYPQQAGPMPDGSNIAQQIDAAVPGSTEAAYAAALRGITPAAKSFVPILQKRLTQEPDWKETSINQGGQIIKGLYDANKGDVMSTFRPFNASADIPLKTAQYSGILPQGDVNAPMGMQSTQTSPFVSQAQSLGLPVISGIRNPLQQAELRHHRDPVSGQWMTKENRPVAENSAHFYGNAIDLKPNATLDANQQAWLNQNAFRPNPTKDANHWEAKPNAGQMPVAGQQPTKYDLQPPTSFNTPKERDEWFAKSREPLTGEPLKMVTGSENTIKALRDLNEGLKTFNVSDLANPDKSAWMNGLAKNAQLALKDAKGLGVLNKEDLPQLDAILRNPSDLKNILNSRDLFTKLANKQIEFAGNVVATNYKNSYKQIPQSTKEMLLKIDQEVAQQGQNTKSVNLDKPVVYNSQSAAQAAGKAGTLKDGQKVVIGGNVYTWKND